MTTYLCIIFSLDPIFLEYINNQSVIVLCRSWPKCCFDKQKQLWTQLDCIMPCRTMSAEESWSQIGRCLLKRAILIQRCPTLWHCRKYWSGMHRRTPKLRNMAKAVEKKTNKIHQEITEHVSWARKQHLCLPS